MFRVSITLISCLGVALSLRRSETEQLSSETASHLKSALAKHISALDKKHTDAIYRSLEKAQGSNLTATLNTIIGNLNLAAQTVKDHVASTNTELENKVSDFEDNVSSVVTLKGEAEGLDNSWNSCLNRLVSNTSELQLAKDDLEDAKGEMDSAETNANGKSNIADSLTLKDFSCDASDLDTDCDAEWTAWKNSTNDNISNLDHAVKNAISAYESANATWTRWIGRYVSNMSTTKSAQTTWTNNRQTCNNLKTQRGNKICSWFAAWEKKCVAKQAYDDLKADAEGVGNVHSQKDREVEYKALMTAVCVLKKFLSGSDIPTNIETQCVSSAVGLEGFTGLELNTPVDYKSTRYQKAVNSITDACDNKVFQFDKGYKWSEDEFSATSATEDKIYGNGVWETLPQASQFDQKEGAKWVKSSDITLLEGTFKAGDLSEC